MESPLITVIIPTYNRADLLPRAIKSVIAQTYINWELLVVDDGSTDNTKEVVEEFMRNDARIKYLWEQNSGGPSCPRNLGIKNSKGQYISFLDSDNEWLANNLEEHLKVHNTNPNIDLSGSYFCMVNHNNDKQKIIFPQIDINYNNRMAWSLKYIIAPATMFFKVNFVRAIGGFDEGMKYGGEDWDIGIRSANAGQIYLIDKCLANSYIDNTSITRDSYDHDNNDKFALFYKKHFNEYKKFNQLAFYYYCWGRDNCLRGNFVFGRNKLKKSLEYPDKKCKYFIVYFVSLFGQQIWNFVQRSFHYIQVWVQIKYCF